jgi:hypothetical protein
MSDEAAPLPLPIFAAHEKVCGNCRLWSPHSIDATRGWLGPCRVQANRGLFPPSAPICDAFAPKGGVVVVASRPDAPRKLKNIAPMIRSAANAGSVVTQKAPEPRNQEIVDLGGDLNMTRQELMDIFLEASGQADVPLAPKWEGGVVQLLPKNGELQGKELPIDSLFHKVVMIRDRLRTLEQKLNGHPKLSDAEKVEMQQYVTRCYGSLTSFNVLFRDKGDQFIGQKGDE